MSGWELVDVYDRFGQWLGEYPAQVAMHRRDATERDARAFERLAARVGTSPINGGRGSILKGWF